jgi:hypothetical protein
MAKALLQKDRKHFCHGIWRAGYQKPAGSLGVGQQGTLYRTQPWRKRHTFFKAFPITR